MLSIGEILRAIENNAVFSGYVRLVGISENGDAWLMQLDVFRPQLRQTERTIIDFDHLRAPFRVTVQSLLDGIQAGLISINMEFDCDLPASTEQLSNSARAKLEKNYSILEPLLADELLLHDPEFRNRAFSVRAKECSVSARNIRRLYYRYLWGGMVKSALCATLKNCGRPGSTQKEGQKRRGRKAVFSVQCELSLPDVRNNLEKGARKFYLPGMNTLIEAYVLTLKSYFIEGMGLVEDVNGTKKLEEIILPKPIRPTFAQFRYVCEGIERQEGKRQKNPRRVRDKENPWSFRGNNRQGVHGPGARFEIDATKLQIQLVSRYGRPRLVGTPTLYVVMDVWSGACVGYALSLENAGWALAARALHNTFQNKGLVFAKLGLPFTDEDWPCHHLTSCLAADRAELISNKSVVPEIGIKVEIMPPMCPELKGLVEGAINQIKHGRSEIIPGSYSKMPRRREPDGKDTAALSLDELEIIIVRQILILNNAPVPLKNIPHQLLQDGETSITRIGLYKWGLDNRPGFTRTLTRKEVYTNLLSKDFASVTPRGIYYKRQTYFADDLAKGYLSRAANGHFPIEIRFDEHLADQIWFLDEFSNDWVGAQVDNDDIRRLKIAFFELESFNRDANDLREDAKLENAHQGQEAAKLDAPMVKQAVENMKIVRKSQSKTEGKSKIRMNREVERDVNRLIEGKEVLGSYTKAIAAAKSGHSSEFQVEELSHEPAEQPLKTKRTNLWGSLNGRYESSES